MKKNNSFEKDLVIYQKAKRIIDSIKTPAQRRIADIWFSRAYNTVNDYVIKVEIDLMQTSMWRLLL